MNTNTIISKWNHYNLAKSKINQSNNGLGSIVNKKITKYTTTRKKEFYTKSSDKHNPDNLKSNSNKHNANKNPNPNAKYRHYQMRQWFYLV